MMTQKECSHLFCKCKTQKAALACPSSHTAWNSCLFPDESRMWRLTHLNARSDLHYQDCLSTPPLIVTWHFLRVHFFKKLHWASAGVKRLDLCSRSHNVASPEKFPFIGFGAPYVVIQPLFLIMLCCFASGSISLHLFLILWEEAGKQMHLYQ